MTTHRYPPAVVEAARKLLYPHLITESDDLARMIATAALDAAFAAWPQRKDEWRDNITFDGKPIRYSVIILPLPTEASDE